MRMFSKFFGDYREEQESKADSKKKFFQFLQTAEALDK